ncbi:MAG: hypothetical protein GY905_09070 [Gammaproteobacteria bacterium]|nr:hypothetical protein [Gammaproteobacteria bacterium]
MSLLFTGIPWDKYPAGSSKEFKLLDQQRSQELQKNSASIDEQSNDIKIIKSSNSALQKTVSILNGSVSQIRQQQQSDASRIQSNSQGVSQNTQSITTLSGEVDKKVSNTDFAQLDVGGVVLLAASVSKVSQFVNIDAPASYDQADEQKFRDSVTLSLNAIISTVNDIIEAQQNAKQMEGANTE